MHNSIFVHEPEKGLLETTCDIVTLYNITKKNNIGDHKFRIVCKEGTFLLAIVLNKKDEYGFLAARSPYRNPKKIIVGAVKVTRKFFKKDTIKAKASWAPIEEFSFLNIETPFEGFSTNFFTTF